MTNTTITITAETAEELLGKLDSVLETDELVEDYGMTAEQAQELYDSIPDAGGSWELPEWGVPVIVSEVQDMIDIWTGEADDPYERAALLRAIRRLKTFLKKLS